jgi:hypothetical protein
MCQLLRSGRNSSPPPLKNSQNFSRINC